MSSHELEARIKKLEDIEQVKKLQYTYAYLIDTLQGEKVPDLFADNFIAEYDQIGRYTTKEELLRFMIMARDGTTLMRHHMLAPIIEVEGDKATGTWYLLVNETDMTPQGEVPVWIQGKYENEYVRVGSEWKFSHLKFKFAFYTPYEDGWAKTRMLYPEISGIS